MGIRGTLGGLAIAAEGVGAGPGVVMGALTAASTRVAALGDLVPKRCLGLGSQQEDSPCEDD